MRARTWAPIATFVAVAAVGVTAAVVHGGGTTSSGPRALHLAGGGATAARSAAGGDYQLAVALSDDQPADQRAFSLTSGPADAQVVAALRRALHSPVSVSDQPGQAWTWSPCDGPDTAVSSNGSTGSGCAVSSGPGSVSGSGTPPDVAEDVVREAARDVLHAVGLNVADATIDTSPYGGSATVDRPGTVGMSTRVDVDRTGAITSATGWLGTPAPADLYPVVSAKDAFARLPRLLHPDICRVAPSGRGCLPPDPVVITGATLGLSLQPTTDGGSALVPSWLFAEKGGGTLAALAVQPQYLPAPAADTGTRTPGHDEGAAPSGTAP
jgi:hypothetical protein